MAKPTAQQCHALTTYFVQKVKEETDKQPVVNRNKARWGWDSILIDYTPSQTRELIDYYIEHYDKPSIDWFLFNYDKVDIAKQEREETEARRVLRRKATQEKLEEWSNRWQK